MEGIDNKVYSLQESYGEVACDSERNVLFLSFKGNIEKEDYKKLWDTLLEEIMARKSRKVIIDQTQIGKVSMDARAWLVIKWMPKLQRTIDSEAKVAVITARSITNKLGAQYLMGAVKKMSLLNIRVVNSLEEAESWFR